MIIIKITITICSNKVIYIPRFSIKLIIISQFSTISLEEAPTKENQDNFFTIFLLSIKITYVCISILKKEFIFIIKDLYVKNKKKAVFNCLH